MRWSVRILFVLFLFFARFCSIARKTIGENPHRPRRYMDFQVAAFAFDHHRLNFAAISALFSGTVTML
jgi:hypothetical protein